MEENVLIVEKIICILGCAALNAWGGWKWHNSRRSLMPCLIALTISIVTRIWWTGLLVLPVIGTLTLGYFSDKNWGRALWLFVQAVSISIGLLITGHSLWYFVLPYVVLAGVLGGIYKNWNQIIGDSITGAYLALIVLIVR